MVEKHILLADPEANTLAELRQALGQPWSLTHVTSGATALEELKKRSYEGLVMSFYLSDIQPSQLLNRVRSKYPQTVRFVLAEERDRDRVVKEALGANQLLTKPFTGRVLIETIERAIESQVWTNNEKLHKLVTRMRALPTVPALYSEIVAALKSPDISVEAVGELISKDMAITTKLLQVINSAYFGLPRTVTNPEEAVSLLGYETVKAMVMTTKLLSQYDRVKMGDFSIEQLWQHSTAVAQNARRIVLLQNRDRSMAEDAFAAGLLHDVGKAVLAANFTDQYKGIESLASKQQIPTWEVEREIFGANHGEVGAHLLGLWGLPMEVLEATALHHQPGRTQNKEFSALTALHVANVLQYTLAPQNGGYGLTKIDMEYLAEIGMVECLPAWCTEILGAEGANGYLASGETKTGASVPPQTLASSPPPASTLTGPEVQPNEIGQQASPSHQPAQAAASANEYPAPLPSDSAEALTQNVSDDEGDMISIDFSRDVQLPEQAEPHALTLSLNEPAPNFDRPSSGLSGKKIMQLVVAVVVMTTLMLGWLIFGRQNHSEQEPLVVNARQAQPVPPEPNAANPPAHPSGETHPTAAASSEATPNASSSSQSSPVVSSVESLVEKTPAQAPLTEPVVTEARFPEMKLQGILFSPRRPSAIINGVLVHTNDVLSGVKIVEIRSSSVTIQFQNRRETLSLE